MEGTKRRSKCTENRLRFNYKKQINWIYSEKILFTLFFCYLILSIAFPYKLSVEESRSKLMETEKNKGKAFSTLYYRKTHKSESLKNAAGLQVTNSLLICFSGSEVEQLRFLFWDS